MWHPATHRLVQLEVMDHSSFNCVAMFKAALRLALALLFGLCLSAPGSADTTVRGQVISVSGGNVITIVDAQQQPLRIQLVFVDVPTLGQPLGDEAQAALAAMVLGREVTAKLLGADEGGTPLAEVIEAHCRLVNIELVTRGLAWHDYFAAQNTAERSQYQAAQASAQDAWLGLWTSGQIELPPDYRTRGGTLMRWWLYVVAGVGAVTLLGVLGTIYDKRIQAWLKKQDELTKASSEAYRLALIQSEEDLDERDRTREIANREMDRLASMPTHLSSWTAQPSKHQRPHANGEANRLETPLIFELY